MKERIFRFKTVPRWAILLLDLLILTWSFTLSYFVAKQFNFHDIIRGHFFVYTGVYIGIALPVFFFHADTYRIDPLFRYPRYAENIFGYVD